METHALDLNVRVWSVSRYGLTAIGTWVRLDDRWRPCMAIVRNDGRGKPCVIPLENAWQWSDVIGDPITHAVNMLPRLLIDPMNPDNVHKLVTLVNSRMQDLVAMPPRPPEVIHDAEPVADLTINSHEFGKTEVSL